MKLTISKREAKLSTNMSFRTEFHGDDTVTAGDIGVSGVMVDAAEFNALMQEADAFDRLFAPRADSRELYDPVFPELKVLKLSTKINESSVTLFVGQDSVAVELGRCTLKSFELDRQKGGLTEVSFLIQSTPTLDNRIGQLLDCLNSGAMIEVSYRHPPKQQDMSLEGGQAAPKKKRGRKPAEVEAPAGAGFASNAAALNEARIQAANVVDPDDPEYVAGPMDTEATAVQ